jgi:hypothetical protein
VAIDVGQALVGAIGMSYFHAGDLAIIDPEGPKARSLGDMTCQSK